MRARLHLASAVVACAVALQLTTVAAQPSEREAIGAYTRNAAFAVYGNAP